MIWRLIRSWLSGGLNAILQTLGKTVTDIHTSSTARQANENDNGSGLAGAAVAAHTAAGAQRAQVQQSQGTWGPLGIATGVIAGAIAFHFVMIVLDSTGWHLVPTLKFYVVPWLEWQQHKVGSWNVVALPKPFDETEHEVIKALFYVGPPSAALLVLAKAFRR